MEPLEVGQVEMSFLVVIGHGWPLPGGNHCIHSEGLGATFHFHALEKEMATHSSVLAWRIPGTGEPGRLPSMGSHRVGHH